ncbi:MAG: NAD-dependent epimerase/dehydratase family protein [Rhodothermales bacterium]|nr:NAD-dependent epimerase/dehydratase family protein [Rhodothermales bacterium]MBO6778489.1 NAD-dependent epimerase/dehydratase family protein [Rhodothermales bacterium]
MADRRPVFVTGGTGFVGSHLVEALRARGYEEIRCLVRNKPGWLEHIAHTPVRGDLTHGPTLAQAMQGCSVVFHVAGRTRARTWEEFEAANITGTTNLLEAAATLDQPPRIQIVSSLAAVGDVAADIADESTPLNPVSQYGRSKALMEVAIEPWRQQLDLSVVRPPAVYGPRDSDIFTVFQAASRRLFAVVGGAKGPAMTLVHVRDLVRGMIDAAETAETRNQTYFLGADPPYSWDQVRDAAAQALGRRVATLRIPRPLIVPVGTMVEKVGGLFGAYPPLNREKALEIRDACIMCTSGAAHRDFAYQASVPLQEGFDETVTWYRAHGWL